jgi:hypothetical protein
MAVDSAFSEPALEGNFEFRGDQTAARKIGGFVIDTLRSVFL